MTRLEMIQGVQKISEPYFQTLLDRLRPPAGIIPPPAAPRGNRVFALLGWVEGTGGCGLETFLRTLQEITEEYERLLHDLSGLPQPQFNTLVFALNIPPSLLPSPQAPQRDRALRLLEYAGVHSQLEDLKEVLAHIMA